MGIWVVIGGCLDRYLGGYWGLFGWVFRCLLGVVWMGI